MLVAALAGGLAASAPAAAAEPETVCVAETAEQAAATLLAAACDAPVEVTDLRSEDTETYANPDGTFTFRSYVEPIRVRRGTGWVPLDTTLQRSGGAVTTKATKVGLRFSAGGREPLGTISAQGKELALSWPGVLPSPSLSGRVATYRDVLPGVDLKVRADHDGFSKVLVVHDPAAAANSALRSIAFGMSTRGVSLEMGPAGSILAVDSAGAPVFGSSGAFMWDSSGPEGLNGCEVAPAEELQRRIPVQLTGGGLTVTPDAAMLTSPDTVFPLCIDPSWNYLTDKWTQVWKLYPDSSVWGSYRDAMRVGRNYGGGSNDVWRTFVRININGLVGQGHQILSATFTSMLDHSASCVPTSVELWHTGFVSPNAPATTWNNSGGLWLSNLGPVQGNANEAGGCGSRTCGCSGTAPPCEMPFSIWPTAPSES